jgi:hypothetical protein
MATGWDEGVPQMSLGEKAILTMSGYGSASAFAWLLGFVMLTLTDIGIGSMGMERSRFISWSCPRLSRGLIMAVC